MRITFVSLLLLFIFVAAIPADAAFLNVDNFYQGRTVDFWYNGNHLTNIFGGSFEARLDGQALPQVYCVDLDDLMSLPAAYAVDVTTTSVVSNGGRVAWIYNNYGQAADGEDAAAVQLALWDVEYDNGDGLGAGIFQYLNSDTRTATATNLIGLSVGQSASATVYKSIDDLHQDIIGPAQPVPEPASGSLMILGGLMAMVPFARKLRRNR